MEKYIIIIVYLLIGLINGLRQLKKVKKELLKKYEDERNIISELYVNLLNNNKFLMITVVLNMVFWLPVYLWNEINRIRMKGIK